MFKFPLRLRRQWNTKKIALVSILIATSVAIVVIFTTIIPIAVIPSFKIAIAGLPIKIAGYIFGPVIGAITGVITDLLSFAIYPTLFHYWYTIAFAVAGFVPGLVGYFIHRRWKYGENNPDDNIEYNNWNFVFAILIILLVMGIITGFVFSGYADFSKSLVNNKWAFFGIVISGSGSMLLATILFRFILKPKTFNALLPIIIFSVILDVINTPLVSLGDSKTLSGGENFLTLLTGHTLLTPIKSWANMAIIFFSYKMVAPLIFNKTANGWDAKKTNSQHIAEQTNKDKMNIYVCGPTVYDKVHIGNLRSIIIFDIYKKALIASGKKASLTHNITDIDDKIIIKAKQENVSEKVISTRYLKEYRKILKEMNINSINKMPLVTRHLEVITNFIEKLLAVDHAYEKNGNVFYRIDKAKEYGQVSGQVISKLKSGKVNADKENQLDFALWKTTTNGITYKSPWGKGRPGWHTECAALITRFYKNSLNIHSGGIDLIFPHHENENTQYRSLYRKPITESWKHIGQVNINDMKMSKSLKNVFTASDFIKEHGADTLRMIFLSSNPTSPLNIQEETILQAKEKVKKLRMMFNEFVIQGIKENPDKKLIDLIINWKFSELNKKINDLVKDINSKKNIESSKKLMFILNTIDFNFTNIKISKSDKKIYKKWENKRETKDYEESDKLRDTLIKKGLI